MKKTILFMALGLFAISANAQKVKEENVPPAIMQSFVKMHPNTKADKWEKEGNNYEAEFKDNGVENSVEFGPNGQFLSSEMEMKVADLPKAVSDYCSKNMPGKKIAEASKITAADGKVTYEVEVDGTDYILNPDGTLVKKEMEKDDDKDDDKK